MKKLNPIIKTIALLTAILITVLTAVIPTAAITVEKDGKQYTFVSHTPTTGDCNVLIVRVGFADYPLDDAVYPATSVETLLSYFDGSEGSVTAFYETSSYGKLHLNCDEVFNYTAPYDRSQCNGAALPQEVLTALEDEIDFDRYDSDNDGWLDYVALVYSGPSEGWGSLWWPHVTNAQNTEVGGKKVDQYTMISGRQSVFSHEFGHILGAPDYYSYFDDQPNALMTCDMMDNNTGDHNGFTKWFYGWLDDDDIAYVDKNSGETTVTLAPIEMPLGDGKKIAVVAPEIDRAKGFMSEYFIVEYDSGAGNNAEAFERYSFDPGFRIFHVRAETFFDDENAEAGFINNNDEMRDNLIHNVKTELIAPDAWETEDNYFREGDALTPNSYPNTGFAVDEVYNGLFTGISFSDFVTGDNPSFKVSFTDDEEQNKNVNFSLSCEDLDAKMNLTLTADKPVVVRNISFPDHYQYTPYLIDSEGNKLMLDIKSDNDSLYSYGLSYNKPEPTVQPMTEYTLVIPEGLFLTGYNQAVPEYRTTLKTPQFLSLTVIGRIPDDADNKVHSNIFSVTDNSYGQIRVPISGTGKCSFTEYNYNGDQIGYTEFELPSLFPTDSQSGARVYACNVYRLNDGNFGLDLPLQDSSSFVKINRQGEALSDVYHVSWDTTQEYTDSLYHIDYDLYKNGISKLFRTNDNKKTGQLIIDFESEPRLVETASGRVYFNLDSNSYAMMLYGKDRGLHIYDQDDQPLAMIPIKSSPHAVIKDGGKRIVVYQEFDEGSDTTTFYADTYSENYELISHRDITDTALHIDDYYYWDHAYANSAGYYLELKDKDSGYENNIIIAYDKDWNYLGLFEFDETVRYIFSGVCGLTQQYQNLDGSICQVISRFSVGDFEIIPAEKLLGDANLDGAVDITDATTIQRYDVKMTSLGVTAKTLADVDRDGDVCILDATWLQRWELKMKAPEGIGEPI